MIIGVWCANGAIVVLVVIASVISSAYLKSKKVD